MGLAKKEFLSSWKRTTKKSTGKLRSSFDSPQSESERPTSASTLRSLRRALRWPRELIDLRHIFFSQYVHRTYNAYVLSQFKKLEQDLRNHGQVRWKHVMHLIRLLLSGVVVLRHGFRTTPGGRVSR